jgi:hypothetical protein
VSVATTHTPLAPRGSSRSTIRARVRRTPAYRVGRQFLSYVGAASPQQPPLGKNTQSRTRLAVARGCSTDLPWFIQQVYPIGRWRDHEMLPLLAKAWNKTRLIHWGSKPRGLRRVAHDHDAYSRLSLALPALRLQAKLAGAWPRGLFELFTHPPQPGGAAACRVTSSTV